MEDEMSFSEIMTTIEKLNVEIQTVGKSIRKKNEDIKLRNISLNRLDSQMQKQS